MIAIFRSKSNLSSDQAVAVSLHGAVLKSSLKLVNLPKSKSDYSDIVVLKAAILHAFG